MLEQRWEATRCNRFDEITKMKIIPMINVATSVVVKFEIIENFYDTTNGHVRGGPLDDIIEESKMILSGELGIGQGWSRIF